MHTRAKISTPMRTVVRVRTRARAECASPQHYMSHARAGVIVPTCPMECARVSLPMGSIVCACVCARLSLPVLHGVCTCMHWAVHTCGCHGACARGCSPLKMGQTFQTPRQPWLANCPKESSMKKSGMPQNTSMMK